MVRLSSPVNKLDGVGIKKARALSTLGIKTIWDLLTYFPMRYNDFRIQNPAEAPNNAKITIQGKLIQGPYINYRTSRLKFRLQVNQDRIWVAFFHRAYLMKKLHKGQTITVYGRLELEYHTLQGTALLDSQDRQLVKAVYPSNRHISKKNIRKIIAKAYSQCHNLIHDYLPSWVKRKYRLEPEQEVIHNMHFPSSVRNEQLARRTAIFNDFFLYQMKLQSIRFKNKKNRGAQIKPNYALLGKFMGGLPFSLTAAQRKCTGEIIHDMEAPIEMNRLLQGDVGSGKTIVAAIAIYAAVTSGYQTAIMVPTSVLAEQHAKSLSKTFKGFGVNIGLLTSDLSILAKRNLLRHIANGDIDLVIGTDALIQSDIKYHRLGLAVIDEQHRFGVDQRQALRVKGSNPNMLGMTATPIPRTLAITAYGDMDVSVINQLPSGRKPVKTTWMRLKEVHSHLSQLKKIIDSGQQMYVVAPLVKQSQGAKGMLDAETIYRTFEYYFPQYKIGLLHGQMDDDKKDEIMTRFKAGRYQILVATTVIEVGVDVANASMMMIFNADHFGLSQLHQLRGRVGRGSQQAYCWLIADPKSKDGKKRMRIMESTTNGFKISQADLKLRGTGDIFGQAQSGIPKFKVGNPINNAVILECAQQEAARVVSQAQWQKQPQNQNLVARLKLQKDIKMLD